MQCLQSFTSSKMAIYRSPTYFFILYIQTRQKFGGRWGLKWWLTVVENVAGANALTGAHVSEKSPCQNGGSSNIPCSTAVEHFHFRFLHVYLFSRWTPCRIKISSNTHKTAHSWLCRTDAAPTQQTFRMQEYQKHYVMRVNTKKHKGKSKLIWRCRNKEEDKTVAQPWCTHGQYRIDQSLPYYYRF